MRHRRVLSIWFPHLGAERMLRVHRSRILQPYAVVERSHNLVNLHSLSPTAADEGLRIGQSLSDARAMCPDLLTSERNAPLEEAFMSALQRWAGQFSPWVSHQGQTDLCMDITGCAHLFGGEADMSAKILDQTAALQLTAHVGIADTMGAAWALARFGDQPLCFDRSGDAIDQEAHATRSRAVKRRNWERGGPRPLTALVHAPADRIAPPGETMAVIAPLPVTALRLSGTAATALGRVGLRRISDLLDLPRATLSRRFGADVLRRLDQAVGVTPEPISPSAPQVHFATRLSFPEPIGLSEDIEAAIKRLATPLCDKLKMHAMGCRKVQLTCLRSDNTYQVIEAGLARISHDANRIIPLLTLQLPKIEPGFGIDMMRLQSVMTEPLSPVQHAGPLDALSLAKSRRDGDTAEEDLIGRLGARIGLERITQLHPADSIIPEKTEASRMVAYAPIPEGWHKPRLKRPVVLFQPEPVQVLTAKQAVETFVWRRREFEVVATEGPERIAPEWWLDDPNWRTGTRDYWSMTTAQGMKLWLFKTQPDSWSCQGVFE
ncbi:MAG: DNA polymerase Y family protein [Pseudomonadota bacterium]